MPDPICKNLIEDELVSIKAGVARYMESIEGLKIDRDWHKDNRDFVSQRSDLKKEINLFKDRMTWLLQNSRAKFLKGINDAFESIDELGGTAEGEMFDFDKSIYKLTVDTTIGKTDIKVGDRYSHSENGMVRVLGFGLNRDLVFLEMLITSTQSYVPKKKIITESVSSLVNGYLRR